MKNKFTANDLENIKNMSIKIIKNMSSSLSRKCMKDISKVKLLPHNTRAIKKYQKL